MRRLSLIVLVGCSVLFAVPAPATVLSVYGPLADATTVLRPADVSCPLILVHGFSADGANESGVYGDDDIDETADSIAAMIGVPTANQAPDSATQVAALRYYGDTPPDYYTQDDIDDIATISQPEGGGIPRYALITAKYIRHVMQRSGASRVRVVGISMGGLVTRWLLEHDMEGLATDQAIERWITLEGVVLGNYPASNTAIREQFSLLFPDTIDVEHMTYDWIAEQLPAAASRETLVNPAFKPILIGHLSSTNDAPYERALTQATALQEGEALPNDGLQLVRDSFFAAGDPAALYDERLPMHVYSHNTHWSLALDGGAQFGVLGLVYGTHRVRITMTEVEVFDLHEDSIWEDDDEAEVVLEAKVYSPLALQTQGVTDPLAALVKDGGAAEREPLEQNQVQVLNYPVFDCTVLPLEQQLRVRVSAKEIDRSTFYGDPDPLADDPDQGYDAGEVLVSTVRDATYEVDAGDWRCVLQVETQLVVHN